MRRINSKNLLRILDANFNRTKEALRVCEDFSRFILDDGKLTGDFKKIRHDITRLAGVFGSMNLIGGRDIEGDVGRPSIKQELERKKTADIFYANIQRAKESVRVLEEFAKLYQARAAGQFKRLRYKLYALEKKAASKL